MDKLSPQEQNEATHIMGEMAASRLHDLLHLRFEELSEQHGLTRREVARRLGTTEQQLSRWMSEPRNMTVKSAGRLMAALDAYLGFVCEPTADGITENCPLAAAEFYGTVVRLPVFVPGNGGVLSPGSALSRPSSAPVLQGLIINSPIQLVLSE